MEKIDYYIYDIHVTLSQLQVIVSGKSEATKDTVLEDVKAFDTSVRELLQGLFDKP